jgi:hypothetical protein
MKYLLIICLNFCGIALAGSQRFEKCKAFGAIYYTNNINEADFIIYIEESEVMGDLKVFKTSSVLYASTSGIWYETPVKSQAQFYVYVEKEKKSLADFTISYTESEMRAGCE